MKKVKGRLATAVTSGRNWPAPSGISATTFLAIASTIPVPDSTPVKTPAAKISDTTASTFGAWEAMRAFCCSSVG